MHGRYCGEKRKSESLMMQLCELEGREVEQSFNQPSTSHNYLFLLSITYIFII